MSQNMIGRVILKRYQVESFIASGGMKTVYKVIDLERSVPLAMKMLHAELEEDPAVLRSFQRETNAIKKLTHPNIVRFYGMDKTGDTFFMLEEFIDGPSLKDVLKERKFLSLDEALIYFRALCAALGFAHANGVVHCDVKPGNVMVDQGGNILLTDFGIARHANSSSTSTFAGAGTPGYMAPEQVRGAAVTGETDIYALGVMLFEMLTGQRPFKGTETGLETAGNTQNERIRYAHLKMTPPDPRSLNPQIPEKVASAILTAMAKAPEDRFAETNLFLHAVCEGAGIAEGSIPTRAGLPRSTGGDIAGGETGPGGAAGLVQPPWMQIWQKVWPKYALYFALAGAALIVLAFFLLRSPGPSVKPTAPPQVVSGASTGSDLKTLAAPASSESTQKQVDTPTTRAEKPTTPPTATPVPETPTPLPQYADRVYIQDGEFLMGATEKDISIEVIDVKSLDDELPAHLVYLDAYWIDKLEVTNEKFAEFVKATGYQTMAEVNKKLPRIFMQSKAPEYFINDMSAYWRNPDGRGTGIDSILDHPVVQVTWQDADKYCQWAGGHLPTEAQWEKAARGTDGRVYPWGDAYDGNRLNASDKTMGMDSQLFIYDDGYRFTAPVGSYPNGASPYGVLDMAGNVLEWVQDFYQKDYYSSSPRDNPTGPDVGSGNNHLLRGGSWFSGPRNSRIAHRVFPMAALAYQNYGFRCAYDK